MEIAEVRVMNDELKEEKAEGFVYHKVDLGPMPVIDYEEAKDGSTTPSAKRRHPSYPGGEFNTGGDVGRRERAALDLSLKGTNIKAQGKAEGRHPGYGGPIDPLPEGEQQTNEEPDLFVEVPTGQRLAVPRQFFGEMWQEGELAVLLGAPGTGKSVLAVQIADALARGKPLPVDNEQWTTDNKKNSQLSTVLYFDLVLDETQFAMRYSLDAQPGDERLRKPHKFSSRFRRFQIDLCVDKPENIRRMQDFVLKQIEKIIVRTGARVAVIDSLDRFNFGLMRNGDLGHVMSCLLRLKRRLGLSLLVIANAPRSRPDKPLAADRLLATRTICSYADNVFAVGHCRWADEVRYIKHLRSRTHDVVLNESFVPSFQLAKRRESFLSFEFAEFRPESVHLDAYMDRHRLQLIDDCRRLRDQGLNQRQIAAELKMSLASVNRALHNWSARIADTPVRNGSQEPATGNFSKTAEQASNDGHFTDPRSAEKIRSERRLSTLHTSSYLENIGLSEPPASVGGQPVSEPGAVATGFPTEPHAAGGVAREGACAPGYPGLTLSFDSYGREIWVEEFREYDNKPVIWYRVGRRGQIHRSHLKNDITFQSVVKQIGSSEPAVVK